tara:strand:+ start:594 stop:755 length:162 start_codon:yes stop_codon:yes gene_type:complete
MHIERVLTFCFLTKMKAIWSDETMLEKQSLTASKKIDVIWSNLSHFLGKRQKV